MQAFHEAHPEYKDHDFYITGESYAGHYVPAVAAKVHAMNKAKQGPHLNLKVRELDYRAAFLGFIYGSL